MELIQTFDLSLLSPPCPTTEEAAVQRVLRVVHVLREFDPVLHPTYECARSKRQAPLFDFSPERVTELVRRNVNKSGRVVFPELGSVFGFFSDMNDDKSVGIAFQVGAQRPPGVNSFSLTFPITPSVLSAEPPFTVERVWKLFRDTVVAFGTQRGAVTNGMNRRRYRHIQQPKDDVRPVSITWMNFFDPTVVDAIGRERVMSLRDVHVETVGDGVAIRLLDTSFDDHNPQHLERQRSVNRQLGLLAASV